VSEARLQELVDREAIRELKARYVRLVDTKDWNAWRELFTDDLHVDLQGTVMDGADTYVTAVRGMISDARSAHHAHMPELTLVSPAEANGVWAQFVYLEWPSDPDTGLRRGMKAYGHCLETYRLLGGEWKIAAHRQTNIRIDTLYTEPLPDSIIGGAPSAAGIQDPDR
jgi:hypothetical protein